MKQKKGSLRQQVINVYGRSIPVWSEAEPWSWHVHKSIEAFLESNSDVIRNSQRILNAGAGNSLYNLPETRTFNVDLVPEQLRHLKNNICSDVLSLPFKNNCFDLAICMGSVLAYVPAIEALLELSRVLEDTGHIIFHFESSHSAEFLFKKQFGSLAAIVNTFNDREFEKAWVYNTDFICAFLEQINFKVIKLEKAHVVSPVFYRITGSEAFSSRFAYFDKMLSPSSRISYFAENILIHAKKGQ